jgi:hypothetical protein
MTQPTAATIPAPLNPPPPPPPAPRPPVPGKVGHATTLTFAQRRANYQRQNGSRLLTARQDRRLWQKSRRFEGAS